MQARELRTPLWQYTYNGSVLSGAAFVMLPRLFSGTLNAGQPGGCFPLTEAQAETLHHDVLPGNLYIADASLLPRSMGNPPILTIMALAKRVGRLAAQQAG